MTPREATLLGRALRKGAVRPGTHFTHMSAAQHRAVSTAPAFRRANGDGPVATGPAGPPPQSAAAVTCPVSPLPRGAVSLRCLPGQVSGAAERGGEVAPSAAPGGREAEWREIPGTDGKYSASDDGRVKRTGRKGPSDGVLKPWQNSRGYSVVALWLSGRRHHRKVHRLILESFVGPGDGLDCRHLDGDKANNSLANLAWGTHLENMRDRVRHGNHPSAAKTECKRGHPFDEDNTYVYPSGYRSCRECTRQRKRSARKRKREQ